GEPVDRHRLAVCRAARAALGSPADAEDAAQEAFLLAYRRLGSFRGDAAFKTWLLTIAWRQAINRRRSLTRALRRLVAPAADEPDAMPEVAAAAPSPEAAAAGAELARAIPAPIPRPSPPLPPPLPLAPSRHY